MPLTTTVRHITVETGNTEVTDQTDAASAPAYTPGGVIIRSSRLDTARRQRCHLRCTEPRIPQWLAFTRERSGQMKKY